MTVITRSSLAFGALISLLASSQIASEHIVKASAPGILASAGRAVSSDWQLVWSDEFDGSVIDPAKWSYEVNCWGGGNDEQQCYTNQLANAFLANGFLHIVARRENYTGPAASEDASDYDPAVTKTLPYTSARLRTKHKGDWRYGRIEARMKLPFGQGTWPAFWMLPTDNVYGGWAASGEIDIMEAVNIGTTTDSTAPAHAGGLERRVHGTLHYGRAWPDNVHSGLEYWLPGNANPALDFHTYAIEWEDGEIRWYVDDVHYATQRASGWYSQYINNSGRLVNAEGNAPFNERFHLILNLAVGGSWASTVNDKGINEAIFPQTMVVDYVRVYQCGLDNVTGHGCSTISGDATLVAGNAPPALDVADPSLGKAATLTLFADDLNSALAYNSYNPDGALRYQELAVAGRGDVIDLVKTVANGNLYFEYSPRLDLSQWQANGELLFDLKLLSRASNAELDIKLDSGWPNASPYRLKLPALNQWQTVRVPLATILANDNPYAPGRYADLSNLLNLLVIEPTAAMHLQLDNIRYAAPLSDLPRLELFTDQVNTPFAMTTYAASGSLAAEIVAASDTSHNQVMQFSYASDEAVGYFYALPNEQGAATFYDISGFDWVEFDLLVVADPRATKRYNIKIDCGHPCSSGDFAITTPIIGQWTHYRIALADLQANPGSTLDRTRVDAPLVIFPAWGNQRGVVLQLDNVRMGKN